MFYPHCTIHCRYGHVWPGNALAVILATPIAWYAIERWLRNFACHANIQWWIFMLAGALSILVAFLTIGSQTIKVALANPVDALRDE